MRKPIIAGNWKMNTSIDEAVKLVSDLKVEVASVNDVEVVVCPPFTHLSIIKEKLTGSNIGLGAQNVSVNDNGAYTGEISIAMLKDIGCDYVILGHSERRQYFNESDQFINSKVKKVLESGLKPIICVGEKLEEREKNITTDIITTQIKGCLEGLSESDMRKSVIAYEPVWAIGTGKTASNDQAQEVHKLIRDLLTELFSESLSQEIRIQYGGSVKPDNVEGLMAQTDIDGALVGGAALKADSFGAIVKYKK